jgi:hypothetical protein
MPCISTKISYGKKKIISGEVKKIIVYQVEHTRMNIAKHQNQAERDIGIQSTIGVQQRGQGKRTVQGV